ncbi:phosphatase PAP2 family protein [Robiginitalea aurantiaca]|uniref:Phosphatase PAP2 family protein n=1 Tax=Robiginitalea aurantiaca TaxID=3056915 RepID=A0ABT7WF25_9FLAO|nr:phosphatase PAP2 family protein [Robiginitalea aurantiaca]MDM9631478.1 phosphatase PAP2 family protein [Robiginitalea aurantiaca]
MQRTQWIIGLIIGFFGQQLYPQYVSGSLPYFSNQQISELSIGTVGVEALVAHDLSNVILDNHGFLDSEDSNPMAITSSVLYTGNNPLGYQTGNLNTANLKWYQTDTGISLIVSGGFFTMAAITYKDNGTFSRVKVRDEINRYLPNYENTIDDYTQYIPYAATYALDAFGVKSRHKLLRKTTTMATALALNGIVVHTMKGLIDEERPDGTANNSFPSGHTTTAFMGAHIFHKEYRHLSPYYSVGAYSLATFTGMFRQLNNRHWISDVMMGAGLGISLTELAYFINGEIYKEKGINPIPEPSDKIINERRPSFISSTLGFASLTKAFDNPQSGVRADRGYVLSAEGAYFFNPYIGLGATIQGQSFPIQFSSEALDAIRDQGYEPVFQALGSTNLMVGPYFQYGFGKHIIGGKWVAGSLSGSDTKLNLREIDVEVVDPDFELLYSEYFPETTFAWSTGFYYKYRIGKITALGIYGHYTDSDLKFTQLLLADLESVEPVYVEGEPIIKKFNSWSAGLSLSVLLW